MNAKLKRVIQAISQLEITFAKHEFMLPPNGVLVLLSSAAAWFKEYHKQVLLHPSRTHLAKRMDSEDSSTPIQTIKLQHWQHCMLTHCFPRIVISIADC